METTESVLHHHESAFVEQDLGKLMENYTEESILVTNMGTFDGRNGIKRLFGDLFADLSQSGTTITVTQRTVKGMFAYLVWQAETVDNIYELATGTFYISDGMISFQTLTVKISSQETFEG